MPFPIFLFSMLRWVYGSLFISLLLLFSFFFLFHHSLFVLLSQTRVESQAPMHPCDAIPPGALTSTSSCRQSLEFVRAQMVLIAYTIPYIHIHTARLHTCHSTTAVRTAPNGPHHHTTTPQHTRFARRSSTAVISCSLLSFKSSIVSSTVQFLLIRLPIFHLTIFPLRFVCPFATVYSGGKFTCVQSSRSERKWSSEVGAF